MHCMQKGDEKIKRHFSFRECGAYVMFALLVAVGLMVMLSPIIKQEMELRSGALEYISLKQTVQGESQTAVTPSSQLPAATVPVVLPTLAETVPYVESSKDLPYSHETPAEEIDFQSCLDINPDFVGWLRLPGTSIDYPVVQSDRVEHYLTHTFYGEKNKVGTLFTLGKTDLVTPSQNIAIYGHHMRRTRAQTMFEPLHNFKKGGFVEQAPVIYFDTLYQKGVYTIFAACNMRSTEWDASMTSFSDPVAFMRYVEMIKSRSFFDVEVEVTAADQLLTLITCDRNYDSDDGRLIVLAVKKQKE